MAILLRLTRYYIPKVNLLMKGQWLSAIAYILLLIIGAYGAFALLLYMSQTKLLYYPNLPSREIAYTPDQLGIAYEEVNIRTSDDVLLHGWYVPVSRPRAVVLFFHGNAGNISHRLDSLKIFHDLNLSTFIFDYRGYGQSEGKVSEQGTYLDAEAAWLYLTKQRQIAPDNIVLFGRSLGAAVAAYLATKQNPKALIIESAFTSVPDMAGRVYPFLPVRLLTRYNYNTRQYVESIRSPILIIHSHDDEIIPFDNGRELYSAAHEPKSFLELRGGHNDGFLISGRMYTGRMDAFITKFVD
jgi:fermentation-respiration switch protein FrsA (DUF1100 family)